MNASNNNSKSNHPNSNKLPFSFAVIGGVVLWLLASLISDRREPWDDALFWSVFYPLSIIAAAGLAFRFPQRAVLLPFIMFGAQFLTMGVLSGEVGSLWVLGMILFAILALPAVLASVLVARISPYRHR